MSSSAKNLRPGAGAGEPLDAIDERLLAALVADARISNKQLAELVGIAPSTALMAWLSYSRIRHCALIASRARHGRSGLSRTSST